MPTINISDEIVEFACRIHYETVQNTRTWSWLVKNYELEANLRRKEMRATLAAVFDLVFTSPVTFDTDQPSSEVKLTQAKSLENVKAALQPFITYPDICDSFLWENASVIVARSGQIEINRYTLSDVRRAKRVYSALEQYLSPPIIFDADKPATNRLPIGTKVNKISGLGRVPGTIVGYYSTATTPIGYCIESSVLPGSVHIYPAHAIQKDPSL